MARYRAAIVVSERDLAGITIREQLLQIYQFERVNEVTWALGDIALVTIEEESIYADDAESIDADLIVFATKHKSESKIPALLTHAPGNWTDRADYGGKPRAVCVAPASAMRAALHELKRGRDELGLEDWLVGMEVTHHGPYFKEKPVLFVELGSSEEQWSNKVAARAVARAALAAAKHERITEVRVGFGGPHYAPLFTRRVLEREIAIGHIVPNYALDDVTEAEVRMAFERTLEKPRVGLVDWKGMRGAQRRRLLGMLEAIGVAYERA